MRDTLLGRRRTEPRPGRRRRSARRSSRSSAARRGSTSGSSTATVALPTGSIDVARARAETYPQPGRAAGRCARPASTRTSPGATSPSTRSPSPLADPGALIDPHGGLDDLRAGLLRVLHDASFVDDPTRALRAARYAARLGFGARAARRWRCCARPISATVSERPGRRPSSSGSPPSRRRARASSCSHGWGLVERLGRAARSDRRGRGARRASRRGAERRVGPHGSLVAVPRCRRPARAGACPLEPRLAVGGGRARRAAAPASRARCSRARSAPNGSTATSTSWRGVRLEISGDDLLAAGVPEGPAIGRGLAAALRAKLDGEADGARATSCGSRSTRRAIVRLASDARWIGASETASAGSRPSCRARRRPSRRGSAASATAPSQRSTSACSPTTAEPRCVPTAAGSPRALGRDPDGVLFGHQVHGAEVRTPRAPRRTRIPVSRSEPAADRASTARRRRTPALTPLVQVADCLPVAVAGERGVAMLHCGWRGARRRDHRGAGSSEVGATAAAIGPGIGPCCYEVGDEVLGAVRRPRRRGRRRADARPARGRAAAARPRRRRAVESSGLCTSCEPELFFSHRRDGGRTGRQAGLVWIDA